MSTYDSFTINPWNFLLRTLMIKVNQKDVERMIKDGISDVNYRSLLLYQNNCFSKSYDVLSYDVLQSVMNITVIIYIPDLDAYIIDNPYNITYSCMSNITVITKQCSNNYDVVKEKSLYGLNNLYSILTRTFKIIYNASESTIYIEGNPSSKFNLFQRIERWYGKACIRIYSTDRCSSSQIKFVNNEFPQIIPIPINIDMPMYDYISLQPRTMEEHSYGLELLNEILESKKDNGNGGFELDKFKAASLYTMTPVYKTGISVDDLANIDTYLKKNCREIKTNPVNTKKMEVEEDEIKKFTRTKINRENVEKEKIGTITNRDFDNGITSYSCRLMSYGTIIVLKDALVGLFVNSNSRTPFKGMGQSRECIFMYMNHYCYYIGRSYCTLYTFNDTVTSIYESAHEITTSKICLNLKTNKYVAYGDFVKSCKRPLIPAESREGEFKQYLYRNINENLNLIYK